MFAFFAYSEYAPCPNCGVTLGGDAEAHECDEERRLAFQLWTLREGIARFELDVAAFLETARGRFEQWYAERTRPPLAA